MDDEDLCGPKGEELHRNSTLVKTIRDGVTRAEHFILTHTKNINACEHKEEESGQFMFIHGTINIKNKA